MKEESCDIVIKKNGRREKKRKRDREKDRKKDKEWDKKTMRSHVP